MSAGTEHRRAGEITLRVHGDGAAEVEAIERDMLTPAISAAAGPTYVPAQ